MENDKLKKRRIDEEGGFKVVIQKSKTTKRNEDKGDEKSSETESVKGEKERTKKRRRIMIQPKEYKIIGGVIRGAELATEVDWG